MDENRAEEMCDSFEDCMGISYVPGECPEAGQWTMRSTTTLSIPGVEFKDITGNTPAPTVDLSCIFRNDDESPILRNFLQVIEEYLENRKQNGFQ